MCSYRNSYSSAPLPSLENTSKDRQQFVDAIVLISFLIGPKRFRTSKLSVRRHSNSAFERRTMLGFAKLYPCFVLPWIIYEWMGNEVT